MFTFLLKSCLVKVRSSWRDIPGGGDGKRAEAPPEIMQMSKSSFLMDLTASPS
jgi:hypothetical protein